MILMEDMDTSDSEHFDMEATDDDWVESGKRPARKRNSKTGSHSSIDTHPLDISDSESLKTEASGEGNIAAMGKTMLRVCCSCSRQSLCKTKKCECRANGGVCGVSCGCVPTRCSNREAGSIMESDELPQSEMAEGIGNSLDSDENEKSRILVSHGAMLLQSALVEKPAETNDDCGPKRKPLSDIGNKLVKSNAPQPKKKKNWRKSVVQLIPVAPPSSQPENIEIPKKPENSVIEADIPLRLPRAMRSSAASNNNLLRERNSDQPDESVVNKEAESHAPRSPVRQARTSQEKENCGL